MSLLRGDSSSSSNLNRASRRMAFALREACRPGTAWIPALVYQNLNLGWAFSVVIGFPLLVAALPDVQQVLGPLRLGMEQPYGEMRDFLLANRTTGTLMTLFLAPVLFRLLAGFAGSFAQPRDRDGRQRPTLGSSWREGRGLAFSTAGLWFQVILMLLGAVLLFSGPTSVLLRFLPFPAETLPGVVLIGMCVALVLLYGFVLTVLFQLGLHSLVRNRRGVGSALLHSWRIAKQDPVATTRAALVDFLMLVGAFVAWLTLSVSSELATTVLPGLVDWLLDLVELALVAIAGHARCAYWSRTYEILGGLATYRESFITGDPTAAPGPGLQT